MAIVAMADAVPGAIASSSEYNKHIDNIEDLDARIRTKIMSREDTTGVSYASGSTFDVQWPNSIEADTSIVTVSGTGSTTFTIVRAGIYLVEASLRMASGTTGFELNIRKNGNRVAGSGIGGLTLSTQRVLRLAVSDVIKVTGIHTTGSNRSSENGAENNNHVTITRLTD